MAATVEGAFVILDRASGPMRRMEDQAKRTDSAIRSLGDSTDKIGSRSQLQQLDQHSQAMRNMERNARTLGTTMRKTERDVTSMASNGESRMQRLRNALTSNQSAWTRTGQAIGGVVGGLKGLATAMPKMVSLVAVATPALIAFGGALAGLTTTLASAVGGGVTAGAGLMGAFAVGLGSIFIAVKPVIGQIKQFQTAQTALNKAIQSGNTGQIQKQQKALDALAKQHPGVGQLVTQLTRLKGEWAKLSKPAQAQFFGFATDQIKTLRKLMPTFASQAKQNMKAVRDAFHTTIDPFLSSASFKGLVRDLGSVFRVWVGDLAKGATSLLDAFHHIVHTIEPQLKSMGGGFAGVMKNFDNFTKTKGGQNFFKGMVTSFRDMVRLVGSIGKLGAKLVGTGGPGDSVINKWTAAINKFTSSLNTDKINKFFSGSFKTSGEWLKTLGALAKGMLGLMPLLKPFSAGVKDLVTALAGLKVPFTNMSVLSAAILGYLGVRTGIGAYKGAKKGGKLFNKLRGKVAGSGDISGIRNGGTGPGSRMNPIAVAIDGVPGGGSGSGNKHVLGPDGKPLPPSGHGIESAPRRPGRASRVLGRVGSAASALPGASRVARGGSAVARGVRAAASPLRDVPIADVALAIFGAATAGGGLMNHARGAATMADPTNLAGNPLTSWLPLVGHFPGVASLGFDFLQSILTPKGTSMAQRRKIMARQTQLMKPRPPAQSMKRVTGSQPVTTSQVLSFERANPGMPVSGPGVRQWLQDQQKVKHQAQDTGKGVGAAAKKANQDWLQSFLGLNSTTLKNFGDTQTKLGGSRRGDGIIGTIMDGFLHTLETMLQSVNQSMPSIFGEMTNWLKKISGGGSNSGSSSSPGSLINSALGGINSIASGSKKKKARGGRIEGQGMRDTVPVGGNILAAPGELIVNRHTEGRVNGLLRAFGTSLGHEVGTERKPHYMAKGGRRTVASAAGLLGGLSLGRTDEGVDFSGSGPIPAVTDGIMTRVSPQGSGTGWPGASGGGSGAMLVYSIGGGRYIYLAENVDPVKGLRVGSQVHRGQQIATARGQYPFLEIGWSDSRGTPLAHGHYSEGQATAEGKSFLAFLQGHGTGVAGMAGAAVHQMKKRKAAGAGLMQAVGQAAIDRATAAAQSKLDATGGGGGSPVGNIPGNLMHIAQVAAQAAGVPFNSQIVSTLLTKESGGRNLGPSGPLSATGPFQVIPGTFRSYEAQGHGNIMNPTDNALAAFRYIKSRYGTLEHLAQMTGLLGGGYHGYEKGGRIPWFGGGGDFIARRPQIIGVGDGGPERVTVTPHGQGGGRRAVQIGHIVVHNRRPGDIRKQIEHEVGQAFTHLSRKLDGQMMEDDMEVLT